MVSKKIVNLVLGSVCVGMPATLVFSDGILKDTKQAVRTAIYDITDKNTVELKFKKGDVGLTDNQKEQLRSALSAYASDGKVAEVVIAAYGDQAYPKNSKESLAPREQEKANDRAANVKKAIDNKLTKSISTYNMAEKPNWFEKQMVSSDAQVKKEAKEDVDDVSQNDAFYEALGRHFAKVGGPGKVIVVMRHESDAVTH